AAGYPAGAVFGGAVATVLLADGDWRDVFYLGATLSAAMLPLCLVLVPESLGHVTRRFQGDKRLALVNKTLRQLGRPPVAVVVVAPSENPRTSVADLFSKSLAGATVLLTAAYFLHMISFYFFLKWVPKIVVDLGFSAAEAGSVLVWANVGG